MIGIEPDVARAIVWVGALGSWIAGLGYPQLRGGIIVLSQGQNQEPDKRAALQNSHRGGDSWRREWGLDQSS